MDVFKIVSYNLTHYQTTNFRLFQTERVCRRQACFPRASKGVIVWEWFKVNRKVENCDKALILSQTNPSVTDPDLHDMKTLWENEKMLVCIFLLFFQCFLPFQANLMILVCSNLSSANALKYQVIILSSGKEITWKKEKLS